MAIFLVAQVPAVVLGTAPKSFHVVPPSKEPMILKTAELEFTNEKETIGEVEADKSTVGVDKILVIPVLAQYS